MSGASKNGTRDCETQITISSNRFTEPSSASMSFAFCAQSGVTPASKNRFKILSCFSRSSGFSSIRYSRIPDMEEVNKESLMFWF